MSRDSDFLVPMALGGAPSADRRWTWSELTRRPAAAIRTPPPRHRGIVHVLCPGRDCGHMVGRVDLPVDDLGAPTFVTWLGGSHSLVRGATPRDGDGSESYWVGRFPLIRNGDRAPTKLWFSATCPTHGPVEIGLGAVWAAVKNKARRPTLIMGTIYPFRSVMF